MNRVLLIDDDDGLRDVFDIFMRRQGFEVACAEDGLKGLAKAAIFQPHLIIVDLMMPNLNGFDVIHRLQAGELSQVPVIVMTGFSDSANEALVRREPNVVDFIAKPVDYAMLAERVRGFSLAHAESP
jgi:two-component system OmpR family response regulator